MDKHIKDFMNVPRGDVTRFKRQQQVPEARWMTVREMLDSPALAYDPHNPGKKVLIGALGNKLIGIDDPRHLMTVAGSRSGKSVGLIGNLLLYPGSVLATDPKGELARITAKARATRGQKVYALDPFGFLSGEAAQYRASYNPMSVLKKNSPSFLEEASMIAEAMVVQTGNEKDPHWDESARHFIEGVIAHVATSHHYEGERNLITVRTLLANATWVAPSEDDADGEAPAKSVPHLSREMQSNAQHLEGEPATADIGHAIRARAAGFYSKAKSERASVQSTIDRHTTFLDYTAFRNTLRGNDFDLGDLKRNPKGVTIYLCFPATRAEISKRWMRIFINQFLDAMERERAKPAVPVLACLDEFPVLGYMKQLETAAGLIASYDVKLWFVLQDWNQGKSLYGDRWETFAGNAGILQAFGNTDLTTTEYLSKRMGRTQVETVRSSEVDRDRQNKGLSGRSESIELYDLMTPDEISRYFSSDDPMNRQLILWAGRHPMMIQRVLYYDKSGPLTPFGMPIE